MGPSFLWSTPVRERTPAQARICRLTEFSLRGADRKTITPYAVSVTVLHLLALILIGALIWASILALPLVLFGAPQPAS